MKKLTEEVIHFERPSEIIYWAKKWEISPLKIFKTYQHIKTNNVQTIRKYLRNEGFAL